MKNIFIMIKKMHEGSLPLLRRVYEMFAILALVLAGIFGTYCVVMAVAPPEILVLQDESMKVLNEPVRGGLVDLELKYCKQLPFPARTETFIEDGIWLRLPDSISNFNTGCRTVKLQVYIPAEIPLNEPIRIVRSMFYRVSPFSEVTEIIKSEYFTVIE